MIQRFSSSICLRCRSLFFQSNHPDRWLNSNYSLHCTRLFSSNNTAYGRDPQHNNSYAGSARRGSGYNSGAQQRTHLRPRQWTQSKPPVSRTRMPKIELKDAPAYFESEVEDWSRLTKVDRRLSSFGIPDDHIHPLLAKFVKEVKLGHLSTPECQDKYNVSRFAQSTDDISLDVHADRVFTNIFYIWASDPVTQPSLEGIVPSATITGIQALVHAADSTYPADLFLNARKMRRKVIMHVGPTNSGKTHNALRALAAAKVGLYAGPLRLLAHEIWERLNLGMIVPLGVEEPEPSAEPVVDSALDVGNAPRAVRKVGNPKYARECNMITGEEQKIVKEGAALLSSTVEMVSLSANYDVAVVDEIQMIADENRGGGWTMAVLGLAAKELHLCGEETAVPLIEAMMKETGDELIVKRYERLSPLSVEEQSLKGDLRGVRKGDCVVAFSRKGIFGLKRRIEELTGMRCAVVYGKLPPETRSEQAEFFNDPNSEYDVIIGSDAIGMGLNLKIKRIVFSDVKKFDGAQERYLSISQTKQIAGRAGRYGLHGDSPSGGTVTTLHEVDLPFLRKALVTPIEPLQFARISMSVAGFTAVSHALPAGSSTQTIYEAHTYCSKVQPIYQYAEHARLGLMSDFIDSRGSGLTLGDKVQLMMAPIPWRDQDLLGIFAKFLQMYRNSLIVDVMQALGGTRYMDAMLEVEYMMASGMPPTSTPNSLDILESLHKILVLYMWMSYRNPVAYSDHEEVVILKGRVERVLDWSLEGVSESLRNEFNSSWDVTRRERERDKISYISGPEAKARRH